MWCLFFMLLSNVERSIHLWMRVAVSSCKPCSGHTVLHKYLTTQSKIAQHVRLNFRMCSSLLQLYSLFPVWSPDGLCHTRSVLAGVCCCCASERVPQTSAAHTKTAEQVCSWSCSGSFLSLCGWCDVWHKKGCVRRGRKHSMGLKEDWKLLNRWASSSKKNQLKLNCLCNTGTPIPHLLSSTFPVLWKVL